MVINSTNINKMNILTELVKHKKDIGNPGPGLIQAQKCGGVKPVYGIPIPLLDNWISNGNTYLNTK